MRGAFLFFANSFAKNYLNSGSVEKRTRSAIAGRITILSARTPIHCRSKNRWRIRPAADRLYFSPVPTL
jgi:hypothetical protein